MIIKCMHFNLFHLSVAQEPLGIICLTNSIGGLRSPMSICRCRRHKRECPWRISRTSSTARLSCRRQPAVMQKTISRPAKVYQLPCRILLAAVWPEEVYKQLSCTRQSAILYKTTSCPVEDNQLCCRRQLAFLQNSTSCPEEGDQLSYRRPSAVMQKTTSSCRKQPAVQKKSTRKQSAFLQKVTIDDHHLNCKTVLYIYI